jgi:hypothetical protein
MRAGIIDNPQYRFNDVATQVPPPRKEKKRRGKKKKDVGEDANSTLAKVF